VWRIKLGFEVGYIDNMIERRAAEGMDGMDLLYILLMYVALYLV
jgi:hypothetical protein